MSVFKAPSFPAEGGDEAWVWGSYSRSTTLSPLPDDRMDLKIIYGRNATGKSSLLGILSLVLADRSWLGEKDDIVAHAQGSGKTSAALAWQMSYRRRIDAAHLAADIVVQDELQVYRHDSFDGWFTEHVRHLKDWAVNSASRGTQPPVEVPPWRLDFFRAATVSAPSTPGCAVDAEALTRCDGWMAEERHVAARPAPAVVIRKLTRQVERFLERAIAEVDNLGRRAGRDIVRYVLGESSSPGDLADRPPLSRIITLFRTSMVGTLTRNAPPPAA